MLLEFIKSRILIISCLAVSISAIGQNDVSNIVIGTSHIINSEVLNQDREIQVFLPDDYSTSNKNYPVLYLLDGQRFFLYGVSLYQSFHEFDLTPDFIVVGISNEQSQRMRTFSAGANDFLKYIKEEVIPMVNTTYRTSNNRLLFGWAYAGGFGINTMIKEPHLFDGFILASPFPTANKIDSLDEFITSNKDLNTFVYFSSDKEENGVKEGTDALRNFLKNKQSNLRWNFKELNGEVHRSTPYSTLYHGIQEYFNHYQELSFSSLEDFNSRGGLVYFKEYYKIRHEKYGKNIQPSHFNRFALLRLAIRANDFDAFDHLFKQLNGEQLTTELKASRACSLADFYLINGNKTKASKLYKIILEKHPTDERALEGIRKSTIKTN